MSPEERQLLEKTYSLAKENNSLLKSMRNHARLGTAMRVLYWVVIIAISLGAYYFIEPYLKVLTGLSSQVTNVNSNSLTESVKNIQDLLK
jgi:alpha-galactosidase